MIKIMQTWLSTLRSRGWQLVKSLSVDPSILACMAGTWKGEEEGEIKCECTKQRERACSTLWLPKSPFSSPFSCPLCEFQALLSYLLPFLASLSFLNRMWKICLYLIRRYHCAALCVPWRNEERWWWPLWSKLTAFAGMFLQVSLLSVPVFFWLKAKFTWTTTPQNVHYVKRYMAIEMACHYNNIYYILKIFWLASLLYWNVRVLF